MKKLSGLVAVCVMVALVAAASAEIDLTKLQSFPDTIYAGSAYIATYQVTNTDEGSSLINVYINVSNNNESEDYSVNFNETDVTVSVGTFELNCDEATPGNFTCGPYTISAKATIDMDVCLSSVPNLQPDPGYHITVFVRGRTEIFEREAYRRGGSYDPDVDRDSINNTDEMLAGTDWRNPRDPDPYNEACYAIGGTRPTPTPTPTQTPEVTSGATTPEETPTPVPTPEKKLPWWILLIVGAGAGIAYLWRRRR